MAGDGALQLEWNLPGEPAHRTELVPHSGVGLESWWRAAKSVAPDFHWLEHDDTRPVSNADLLGSLLEQLNGTFRADSAVFLPKTRVAVRSPGPHAIPDAFHRGSMDDVPTVGEVPLILARPDVSPKELYRHYRTPRASTASMVGVLSGGERAILRTQDGRSIPFERYVVPSGVGLYRIVADRCENESMGETSVHQETERLI